MKREGKTPATFLLLDVRVTPRGGQNAVIGWNEQTRVLLVRVSAAPVEGAANEAVARLLANALGLRPRQIELAAGKTTRNKRFRLTDLAPDDLAGRLAALPSCPS